MPERYTRQTAIPAIGEGGQKKLLQSKALVVGAGGLGSPVLYYLCAAGIGGLGIVDADTVSESNLNRQILHTERDIGAKKTSSAAQKLQALNGDVTIREYPERLTMENGEGILSKYDIVVDCVDSIESRLLVNSLASRLRLPLVEGGIEGFFGFVMSTMPGFACYGCLHSAVSQAQRAVPVLGAAAGAVGSMQAAECIKLLLGIGEPLLNQMLYVDLLAQEYTRIAIAQNPSCPICGS